MVFIIAEAGVNFRDMNEADIMIKEAATAGVDAVKFQVFTIDHLPDWLRPTPPPILTETDVRYLYWRCRARSVEFMATPFYPAAVDLLNPYVKRWKIRCNDPKKPEIILDCIQTGKQIIVSKNTEGFYRDDEGLISTLYCCPQYPPSEYPNFYIEGDDEDRTTGSRFIDPQFFRGYSCHIPEIEHIIDFVSKYPTLDIIEVHVKRDEYNPPWCCPDNNVSITMSELAELCRRLKR